MKYLMQQSLASLLSGSFKVEQDATFHKTLLNDQLTLKDTEALYKVRTDPGAALDLDIYFDGQPNQQGEHVALIKLEKINQQQFDDSNMQHQYWLSWFSFQVNELNRLSKKSIYFILDS